MWDLELTMLQPLLLAALQRLGAGARAPLPPLQAISQLRLQEQQHQWLREASMRTLISQARPSFSSSWSAARRPPNSLGTVPPMSHHPPFQERQRLGLQ